MISHIGTLSKSQNPKGLFNSVKNYNRLNNEKPIFVKCIGNVHSSIERYAIKNSFNQYLSIMPYVEHSSAINEMINSDILFVVIPDLEKNHGIITGKLFEYIASGTEIILIGKKNSESSRILMDLGYQHVYGINDEIDFNSLLINNHNGQTLLHKFSRIEQSKQLSQIFNMLLEESHIAK